MRATAHKLMRRAVSAAYGRLPIVGDDGFDISELIKLKAAMDTADYCVEHLTRVPTFDTCVDLLTYALKHVKRSGSVLEFGVASGATINHISAQVQGTVHGFDSFEGLPEDWQSRFRKGHFAQAVPTVNGNVALHVGFFDKTLPEFVATNDEGIAFLHVDCDLYSSTKTIFAALGDRLSAGSVIVFDEYFNHPTWRYDEWLAFQEFVSATGTKYEYIGYVPRHQQAAVVIV